ncbi:MAG TPA: hypothetical protein PKW18_01590 [Candidatus Sumerlaeota bacterium]|nr:hypothetical protein [Candidatus Sumerlaeota bacterium]
MNDDSRQKIKGQKQGDDKIVIASPEQKTTQRSQDDCREDCPPFCFFLISFAKIQFNSLCNASK